MEKGEEKFDLEEFIFRYKFWIGGVLLFLIMIGSGILMWRENYWKSGNEDRIKRQEVRIRDLELKIAEEKGEGGKGKVEGVTSEIKESPIAEVGKVAGTSTEKSPMAVSENKIEIQVPKVASKPPISGKVNINTANEQELDALSGIGPVYAKRIVDYRTSKGPFKSIDDIKNVQGIGDKTFLKFKDQITI